MEANTQLTKRVLNPTEKLKKARKPLRTHGHQNSREKQEHYQSQH